MPYSKTTWVDRVVSGGTVITAGTPLSASNLNKIENQLETTTTLAEGALQTSTTGTTTITTSTRTQPALSLNKSGAGVGDGSQFLRLTTERSWSFFQRSTGATSSLSLQDNTGGKNFLIQGLDTGTSTPYTIATFSTGTTSANSFVTFAGALNVTGATTTTGLITANGGVTVPAGQSLTVATSGTVSLPANSITNTMISTGVSASKITTGTLPFAQLPFDIESGTYTFSSVAGTTSASQSITFTAGRFSSAPNITATVVSTAVNRDIKVTTSGSSTSGFTLYVYNGTGSALSLTINWIAVR